MAAPKKPNPGPGAATRLRIGQDTKAANLREAGWLVLAPEKLDFLLSLDGPMMRVWLLAYIEQARTNGDPL